MKYLSLVWRGIWYKPRRTVLTMATIVVAFMLFGLLQGLDQGTDAVIKTFNNRLFTGNRHSVGQGIPISYLNRIREVPGVTAVTHWTFFGGYYREPENSVAAYATTAEAFEVYSQEFVVPPKQAAAMASTRTGAVVAKALADKHGWEIGDRVSLRTSLWLRDDGSDDYQFDIVGLIPVDKYNPNPSLRSLFLFNYSYLDAMRQFQSGRVHYFVSSIDDVTRANEISRDIDALHANSADDTLTTPESARMRSQLQQLLDFGLIVKLIMSAVFLTLLLVTANSIAQSVRERRSNFAVLKTIGFSDGSVAGLVLCETLVVCAFAAALGLLIARGIFGIVSLIFGLTMPASVVVQGAGIAVLLALLSGVLPAWRIQRLSLVAALAHR